MLKTTRFMIALTALLLGAAFNAQAGHLFTQAATNSPVALLPGQGIDIPQLGAETAGTSSAGGSISLFINGFGAGDTIRLTIGGISTDLTGPSQSSATGPFEAYDPGTRTCSLGTFECAFTTATNWRVDNIAGDGYTFLGYRIRVGSGANAFTFDGTQAGLVNQTQVTPTNGVPEPGVLWLLGLGLLALCGLRALRRSPESAQPMAA